MASWRGAVVRGLGMAIALAMMPTPTAAQATGAPSSPAAASTELDRTDAARSSSSPVTPTASPTQPMQEATVTPRPIRVPADPTAAAVYAVLDKHCARCHQAGRLNRTAPAAALGNILRLDELAATPSLVQPGNPDASRLYLMMLRRLMPLNEHADGALPMRPTADEIALVRSWIAGLPARQQCRDRRVVAARDHAATLLKLKDLTGEDPKKLRFLSIAHLHNGCVSVQALAAYRQAIVRLVNSLSWKAAPVAVPPVDPAGTLFKINLDDLGWLPEHWERIMRSGYGPLGLTAPMPPDVRRDFGSDLPVARADWFAETVLSAPLYYEVLGLPGTGPEILKILQITGTDRDTGNERLRSVAAPSSFSEQASLIERRRSHTGPVWQAYHWLAVEEAPEISGETAPHPAAVSPPYHAERGLFTLPNGLPGFFVIGQRGDRLDALPPGIARPSVSGGRQLGSGLDCMACHRNGPAAPAARDGDSPGPLDRAVTADRQAISGAMRRVGIDPELTLDGVTPVVALAEEYARPVDGARAVAELGIDLSVLRALADRGADAASVLARRLIQGLVGRTEVEAHAQALASALGLPHAGASSQIAPPSQPEHQAAPADPGPGLILYSDKASYRKGDSLQLFVRVLADCHLTVISVDTRGRATVLFPSDFETNSLLTAGQELHLPGRGAPYTLRLNETGRESIVALCNAAGTLTDNIRYDFERQRFTDLGNYATFLSQNATADGGGGSAPAAGAVHRNSRRPSTDAVAEIRARPDQISRTAISIIVE
ncbi:MAG: DUF4384 domain-containing protein [Hyphomicrobiaceae bacterium]